MERMSPLLQPHRVLILLIIAFSLKDIMMTRAMLLFSLAVLIVLAFVVWPAFSAVGPNERAMSIDRAFSEKPARPACPEPVTVATTVTTRDGRIIAARIYSIWPMCWE